MMQPLEDIKQQDEVEGVCRWEQEGGNVCEQKSKSGTTLTAVEQPPKNSIMAALHDKTIRQLITKKEYVTSKPQRDYTGVAELLSVPADATLLHALKIIEKNRISCVPVLKDGDKVQGTEQGQRVFCGFVDAVDITSYLVKHFIDTKERPSETEFLQTNVSKFVDDSHRDPNYPMHQDLPACTLVDLFAKGVHRVPVFGDNKIITGLCSQYDLVCAVSDLFDTGVGKKMGKQSLQSYMHVFQENWGSERVVAIPHTATVAQALTKIAQTGLSSVAITDVGGDLVGQARVEDLLRTLVKKTETLADWLNTPLAKLLSQESEEVTKPMFELATLSLASACKLMVDHHVHNIWIVDGLESAMPIGVFTLTDAARITLMTTM